MSRVLVVSDQRLMTDLIDSAGEAAAATSANGIVTDSTAIVVGFDGTEDASIFIRRVKCAVIEQCGRGGVSLDELCRELGTSRPTLYRKVRNETGMSPASFVRDLRLELAGCLTLAGLSVTEVAHATGFVSVSHFSRAFREHFSAAPSAFRVAVTQPNNVRGRPSAPS
jgi:AraC-like DNA-binding protein